MYWELWLWQNGNNTLSDLMISHSMKSVLYWFQASPKMATPPSACQHMLCVLNMNLYVLNIWTAPISLQINSYNVAIYICACMHVCMYACMHVCMYACMHVCMYAVCMYACMHVCMYACMHVCMYACMDVCMYVCMHVCMYVYIKKYKYIRRYTLGLRSRSRCLLRLSVPRWDA